MLNSLCGICGAQSARSGAARRGRAQVASGQPVAALWQGYADPLAWGAILWASLGPGALAAFLQTQARPLLRMPPSGNVRIE
jgi:hypothetical protein